MTQDHWSQTLEAMMDWLAFNDSLPDAVVLRRFMDVVARAPHLDLVEGVGDPDAATIDRLIAADACDALALRLIGKDSGFFLSRGGSGDHLVSVLLSGRVVEVTAAGATLVRAVVHALALTLARPDPLDHRVLDHAPRDHAYANYAPPPAAGATLH